MAVQHQAIAPADAVFVSQLATLEKIAVDQGGKACGLQFGLEVVYKAGAVVKFNGNFVIVQQLHRTHFAQISPFFHKKIYYVKNLVDFFKYGYHIKVPF